MHCLFYLMHGQFRCLMMTCVKIFRVVHEIIGNTSWRRKVAKRVEKCVFNTFPSEVPLCISYQAEIANTYCQ